MLIGIRTPSCTTSADESPLYDTTLPLSRFIVLNMKIKNSKIRNRIQLTNTLNLCPNTVKHDDDESTIITEPYGARVDDSITSVFITEIIGNTFM